MNAIVCMLLVGGMMMTEGTALADARIGQVGLIVTDLDRTRSFYEGKLGLSPQYALPNMLVFELSGTTLLLSLPENELRSVGGAAVYLEVPDVVASARTLRERGVTFIDEPHAVHRAGGKALWMTFLRDPDDNLLALMSRRDEHE